MNHAIECPTCGRVYRWWKRPFHRCERFQKALRAAARKARGLPGPDYLPLVSATFPDGNQLDYLLDEIAEAGEFWAALCGLEPGQIVIVTRCHESQETLKRSAEEATEALRGLLGVPLARAK